MAYAYAQSAALGLGPGFVGNSGASENTYVRTHALSNTTFQDRCEMQQLRLPLERCNPSESSHASVRTTLIRRLHQIYTTTTVLLYRCVTTRCLCTNTEQRYRGSNFARASPPRTTRRTKMHHPACIEMHLDAYTKTSGASTSGKFPEGG